MTKRILLALTFLIPTVALALDIQPGSPYIDVRASSVLAPSVNLLTRAGVVQGIGKSRFGQSRLVNRAEFLKMAVLSLPEDRRLNLVDETCFPDVQAGMWFAPTICAAKKAGIVSGNNDPSLPTEQWTFNPCETVTYDAALKMMTLLFGYDIPYVPSNDWGESYYQSAVARKVDLPIRISFDTQLTRGNAARLIAAFMAEADGQLQNLRYAEAGRYDLLTGASSSASLSSSVSSASSTSSASSASSVSSASSLFTLPPVSHFLIIGSVTDAIGDIVIPAQSEPTTVAVAQVKLYNEVRSILNLELVTTDGTVVATLVRKPTSDTVDYKMTFDAQVTPEAQVALAADTSHHLVLRATMRGLGNDGSSEELLQVRTISVTLSNLSTNGSVNFVSSGPFPKHQTSFSHITEVQRTSPAVASLQTEQGLLVIAFTVKASGLPEKSTHLDQLTFTLHKVGSYTANAWELRSGATAVPCSMNEAAKTVTCPIIGDQFGAIPPSGLALELRANVTLDSNTAGNTLQLDLFSPGSPITFGSVQWTDGGGDFGWIEGGAPVMTGTMLK